MCLFLIIGMVLFTYVVSHELTEQIVMEFVLYYPAENTKFQSFIVTSILDYYIIYIFLVCQLI